MNVMGLKEMLREPGIILVPGAYDAWSARLIEKTGFRAIYMSGYGVSASVTGKPDLGIVTMTEMATIVKNISSAVNLPLIADADTGYGGVHNVLRTVQEYELNGCSAIQLEDQAFPKRCGHMEGKQVVAKEEMIARIKAAIYARKSDDFLIIARTDARAVNGFQDAINRCLAYIEAGADIIFFEAPQSVDEMEKITKTIDKPLIANMVEGGKSPLLNLNELNDIGYKIALYPASTLYAATKSMISVLNCLNNDGSTERCLDNMVSFSEFNELVGVKEQKELEEKLN